MISQENKKHLTPSMEDYLEMVFRSCQQDGYCRIGQLAEQLHVQLPSVSRVVQKLKEMGYIRYQKYGIIQLTEQGREAGGFLWGRHKVVESFLKAIGIDENLLFETEMIEHYVSKNTLKYMEMLTRFLSEHSAVNEEYLLFKAEYLNSGGDAAAPSGKNE